MTITNISDNELALQKQVLDLQESLRMANWNHTVYMRGAEQIQLKYIDEIRELRAKLAEVEAELGMAIPAPSWSRDEDKSSW